MSSITEWDSYKEMPTGLEDLLKEVVINNSFDQTIVTDHLKQTMESSYAYLYKYQKDSVHFKKFHYQTREFLLNTTYNDIQKGLKIYGDQLMELENSENPDMEKIAELKRTLAEFGEVRFGDLYLDSKRRVCVNLPIDIVKMKSRETFRHSYLYKNELTISQIITHANIFETLPVVILDDGVRNDILVYPFEQGTKIIFQNLKPTDLYTVYESQKFHDICVMFTDPIVYNTFGVTMEYLQNGFIPSSAFPYDYIKNAIKNKSGMFFASLKSDLKFTHLMDAELENDGIRIHLDTASTTFINENSSFEMNLIFIKDLHSHVFYTGNTIPTENKIYQTPDIYEVKIESLFFIPTTDEKPYLMPIPESNFIIMKSDYGQSSSIESYKVSYGNSVKMYYPNMYQITGDLNITDRFKVYFVYKDEVDIQYTPLFDFYWDYLKNHFMNVYGLEELINLMYFKKPGYDDNIAAENLEDFYNVFEKLLHYQDYDYIYNTPDFIHRSQTSDMKPLHYIVSKMKEFVRADWEVLHEYVHKQRKMEKLYHFFTNTINLSGRFRRSTRLESREVPPILFANSCRISNENDPNALCVTDKLDYDKTYEIYIDDAKIMLPSVAVGDYVSLVSMRDRYVFAFKNSIGEDISLKIFVDGILCSDVVKIHSLGMDYLYLPVDCVSENSYIMMEREYHMPDEFITSFNVSSSDEWNVIHLIETENLSYTANDINIMVDGVYLDKKDYTIQLIRNNVSYSMYDEAHNITNKYGVVVEAQIQLTNVEIASPIVIDVIVNKTFFKSFERADRNGYPRFDLATLKATPDISFARMYYNGRLAPSNSYKLVQASNKCYIQSRVFCEIGDQYHFEFSPYAKELICEVEEFDPNKPFDFSKYIDKPIDPEYYEVYVNGRRLGLPNLFPIGPYKGVFRGLKSKYLLSIYENERDFEYFGYSKITKEQDGSKWEFFYLPTDLLSESFITDGEAEVLIDAYINDIKHKNAIILPNVSEEEPITFTIEDGLIEEMKIFFFEELLPLGLGDPNTLQFNKTYFSEVFPNFTKEFMVSVDENSPEVIFLNPDITARIYDNKTGEYEIIDTKDSDINKRFIMLTGKSS